MAINLNDEPASNYTNDPMICGHTLGDIRKALLLSRYHGGTIEAYKQGWRDAVNLMQKQLNRMIEDIK